MTNKRIDTLKEKYSLPKRLKVKIKYERCPNCQGTGSLDTIPSSKCSQCGDTGWVVKEND